MMGGSSPPLYRLKQSSEVLCGFNATFRQLDALHVSMRHAKNEAQVLKVTEAVLEMRSRHARSPHQGLGVSWSAVVQLLFDLEQYVKHQMEMPSSHYSKTG
jgi:hypothetical protein